MLFRVNFIINKNENKKFIVSGANIAKCKKLASSYIKDLGGAIGLPSMKKIKKYRIIDTLIILKIRRGLNYNLSLFLFLALF